MSDIFCVTNRQLCTEPFLQRIERLAAARPAAILLREKDLSEAEYRLLAQQVLEICRAAGTRCILHSFWQVALELQAPALHLPLPLLRQLPPEAKAAIPLLGASCHSVEDAKTAQALGYGYITAGHVFDTACKKGLPGRGLDFLQAVCQAVSLPVYAIGGITPERMAAVVSAGAAGACVMSGAMTCASPQDYLSSFGGGPSCKI